MFFVYRICTGRTLYFFRMTMYNGCITDERGERMQVNVSEALRYLGVHSDPDGMLHAQMTALAQELSARCTPRWTWRLLDIDRSGSELTLSGTDIALPGRSAAKMLADCAQCAVLVCTLGTAFDAWIRAEQARDMRRAVMLDALGSAWVEAGCDAAEKEIAARFPGQHLTDRFSPGYGDLPLDIQPGLLASVDAARRLGVHTTESHLMIPQKSVSALIGVAGRPQMARIRGCAHCAMSKTCTLRKAGKACDI